MPALPSSERVVARNFLTLGLGELAARAIGYLVLIYIARELGAAAYGTVGYAQAVVLYLAGLVDFGIEAVGPREVAAQPSQASRLLSSVLTVRVAVAGASALLIAAVGLGAMPSPDGAVLALFGLSLFATAFSTRWVHVGLEQVKAVAIARTVGELVKAIAILLLVHDASDILRVAVFYVAGDLIGAGIMLYQLRTHGLRFRWQFDREVLRPVFRAAAPLVVVTISGMMIYNADLVMLRFLRGREAVGFYLAAYTLITLIGNLGGAYQSTLTPALSRADQTVQSRLTLYHTSLAQVFAFTLPMAVGGFLLASPIIAFWFGPEFQPASAVLGILILTIPLALLRLVQHAALIATGHQRDIMRFTVAAAALNVGLNLLVIPRYGIVGAALATLTTEIVRSVLAQVFTHRAGLAWPSLTRFWQAAAAAAAMAALLVWLDPDSMWVGLALGVVAYALVLALCGGLSWRGRSLALTV